MDGLFKALPPKLGSHILGFTSTSDFPQEVRSMNLAQVGWPSCGLRTELENFKGSVILWIKWYFNEFPLICKSIIRDSVQTSPQDGMLARAWLYAI
jgi:hypothetical protein